MKIVPFTDTDTIISFTRNQQVVIMPTDTVYGLSVTVNDPKGQERLNIIKGRAVNQPILVLVTNVSQITELGWGNEAEYQKLEALSKLGPLTGILSTKNETGQAVRLISPETWLGQVITKTGPIYSTSANKHRAKEIVSTADQAREVFRDQIDLFVTGETSNQYGAKPSTIIDIRNTPITVIREGGIKLSKINRILAQ